MLRSSTSNRRQCRCPVSCLLSKSGGLKAEIFPTATTPSRRQTLNKIIDAKDADPRFLGFCKTSTAVLRYEIEALHTQYGSFFPFHSSPSLLREGPLKETISVRQGSWTSSSGYGLPSTDHYSAPTTELAGLAIPFRPICTVQQFGDSLLRRIMGFAISRSV
ncbi:hypothetical protein L228DRAFT_26857 [Xylona heveae TC161]|uniref:Uncharacterized protein n=1 Tax=Xylona heveae (strain CBS 132557 / TC161) TaxID=1328760 RepID=A0A165AFA1_XYLHT|nr:hypothetical protein L228DRAFT_26857 [Xylona heveae TC161]KZF20381.1 hypothetical protein L228DRAFT_26857 [Xylona heveae TC161]